ncbi:hypothetical protein BHM03_00056976 [Ensete ventricosum]|nr:hypothetical protein BHM03_00056976 [Ensete ventricosum]
MEPKFKCIRKIRVLTVPPLVPEVLSLKATKKTGYRQCRWYTVERATREPHEELQIKDPKSWSLNPEDKADLKRHVCYDPS